MAFGQIYKYMTALTSLISRSFLATRVLMLSEEISLQVIAGKGSESAELTCCDRSCHRSRSATGTQFGYCGFKRFGLLVLYADNVVHNVVRYLV